MAAPMRSVRIQLTFEKSSLIANNQKQRSWFLVDKESSKKIHNVVEGIIGRFGLESSLNIELYLNECFLPQWESTEILRDNDNILYVLGTRGTICDNHIINRY